MRARGIKKAAEKAKSGGSSSRIIAPEIPAVETALETGVGTESRDRGEVPDISRKRSREDDVPAATRVVNRPSIDHSL